MRELIPAVLYRLDRCDADDGAALQTLFGWVQNEEDDISALDELGSAVLGKNVALSELWSASAPDASTLQALEETLLFSTNGSAASAQLVDTWPLYPQDAYVGAWPTTDIPILMGNGTLDPQTPPWLAQPAETHFTGTHQYYFEFPLCAHGLFSQSPVIGGGRTCFLQMMLAFVADPTTAPDSSCTASIDPLDFSGHEYSSYFFGTEDLA